MAVLSKQNFWNPIPLKCYRQCNFSTKWWQERLKPQITGTHTSFQIDFPQWFNDLKQNNQNHFWKQKHSPPALPPTLMSRGWDMTQNRFPITSTIHLQLEIKSEPCHNSRTKMLNCMLESLTPEMPGTLRKIHLLPSRPHGHCSMWCRLTKAGESPPLPLFMRDREPPGAACVSPRPASPAHAHREARVSTVTHMSGLGLRGTNPARGSNPSERLPRPSPLKQSVYTDTGLKHKQLF